MNEQLKFSWGHIIAFLALIFIGYVSFMGIIYMSDGDFSSAYVGVIVIIVLMLLVFIGAQILKSTEHKFKTRIWLERSCIFFSPVIFVLLMGPYSHFWTVYENKNQIISQFDSAIIVSKQMFADYEVYAENRVDNYDRMLQRVINNKRLRRKDYQNCGFNNGNDLIQRKNKIEVLQLQLKSENYDSLKTLATQWIDNAEGASVWNVFLLGNIKQIKNAINDWHNTLVGFSENILSDEDYGGYNAVSVFDSSAENITVVENRLDKLNSLYTRIDKPTILALISGFLCYIFMLLPYGLQERHAKSTYRLLGRELGFRTKNLKKSKGADENEGDIIICMPDDNRGKDASETVQSCKDSQDENDYESFSL